MNIARKKQRFKQAAKKNGLVCHLCGKVGDAADLTIDHIYPKIYFKGDRNTKLACDPCNKERGFLPVHYYKMFRYYTETFNFLKEKSKEPISKHFGKFWSGRLFRFSSKKDNRIFKKILVKNNSIKFRMWEIKGEHRYVI